MVVKPPYAQWPELPPCGSGVSGTRRTRPVYGQRVGRIRINIEVEDTYVRTIMDRYAVHTNAEAVDLALRHLAGRPMTRAEALAMRGACAILDPPGDASPQRGA